MDEKHVADYFVISGVSENPEFNTESKQLINPILPITDITVIFRALGEQCPIGYTCIETTPGGHLADLNNGNFKSPNIQICYRRGADKPPLVDVGVYHEEKERPLSDVEVVYKTPYGRHASTGNSSGKMGTYITYRRAKTQSPFNQLVVVDLCVILNNKSEHPPHAFYSIKKNLNKSYYGMVGSEVFLCYKKTLLSPPSLCYTPQIISRFPLQDYANFPLPGTVPLFCLPTGANIELWPANTPMPRPVSSTFVLTSDSAQKMYGTSLSFYEIFDQSRLTTDQKTRLNLLEESDNSGQRVARKGFQTYAIKSICILSRWPFFECFDTFLNFLHKLVFYTRREEPGSLVVKDQVPLEHHISHFLLDVGFPTTQRPSIMVQLMAGTDDTVIIDQPFKSLPLPLTGASFSDLLLTLGVENTMNVLLFGLCEQKILLHSLKPAVLTGAAEAITAMMFPFHWQCPYVPLCPLSLHGILNAPLPFIVGIDSRCFDTFTPPDDIICIDLDTSSIFLSELKKCLNLRILPKRASRVLRGSLEKTFQKLQRLSQVFGSGHSPQHRASMHDSAKQCRRKIDLEIQEAFIRFMANILRGFRSYLLPITKAPTVGATDPTSLFNFEEFLMSRDRNYSQFYQLITKTQMFTHYIEERSFVSDKDTSLAFFDDCEEKLAASDDIFSDRPIKLFDIDDAEVSSDRSVYIPAPELSPNTGASNGDVSPEKCTDVKFGPLNSSLFHRHPQVSSFPSLDRALSSAACVDGQLLIENYLHEPSSSISISRRTKQEVKTSQKQARKSIESSIGWSKYLVSCCYCLWFSTLPSYLAYYKANSRHEVENDDKHISRILRFAYSTIIRMQKIELTTDEICFRVLTLLCGHYGQPALAVRVFFEMRKAGIKPNAVTYGYYNKAVLESKWPDHSQKPTTVLWAKIRNVISGVALFKSHGRLRMARRNARCLPLIGDPSFSRPDVDVVDNAAHHTINGEFFHPTTLPLDRDPERETRKHHDESFGQHRRSLINRSYSTYQRSSDLDNPLIDMNTPVKNQIQKSHSMHLRDGSPERVGTLIKTQSSSSEEDDMEPPIIQRVYNQTESSSRKPNAMQLEIYKNIRDKNLILIDSDNENFITKNVDLLDSMAGLLFTSNPNANQMVSTSPDLAYPPDTTPVIPQTANGFLQDSNSIVGQNHLAENKTLLDASSFGEDAQILMKLESQNQETERTMNTSQDDNMSEETRSNRLSESTADPSECSTSQDEGLLRSLTSTPNFKLSSLINDASNLQWSKWTSTQNSKNVYKQIKSAATGIVSSFQEMKSSFSISNSNTPAKLISSAQHKSTATREMLSQWANYFSSQPSRNYEDSDEESNASNDLMRLSNDVEVETCGLSAEEYGRYKAHFVALEKYYNTSCSKEDLLEQFNNHEGGGDDLKSRTAIDIKMTTCSRCNVCHSLLYDEEIMERWSHNESNLNTRCVYCRAKIVPLMTVSIEDRRFSGQLEQSSTEKETANTATLSDLEFENDKRPTTRDNEESAQNDLKRTSLSSNHVEQTLTVPYLSPIVLRKELESVFESSGDSCPAGSQFVDEHPIIFWNLLWYFNRINVPSHLAQLCLSSKSILGGRTVPEKNSKLDRVNVKCLWDNEKLHAEMGKPLYRYWERGDPSLQVQALIVDGPIFTYSFLQKVVDLLRANELNKAMNLILNGRLKSSSRFSFDKNRHNLYRDLMFLTNVALGPGRILVDNFEREYKKAFEDLNFQQVALNRFDRPPSMRSLYCRKYFKELIIS